MLASQIEFPLPVAVCAWCRPKVRAQNPETLSHGICPRHLRKFKLAAHGALPGKRSRSRSLGGRGAEEETAPFLPL